MIAEMQVLKCQRPWKSSLTRLMVWCSLRWMARACRRQFGRHGLRHVGMIWLRIAHNEPVHASQESLNAFNPRILPVEIAIGRRGEQAVQARGVGAVARDHLVGRDHVAQALRHLRAVFDHHALREQALDGLVVGDQAQVAHELGPEARIDQVQNGVLDAADVLVDAAIAEPVLRDLAVERRVVVARVGVAIEIPGRIDERVHGVGLAARRAATLRTRGIRELRHAPSGEPPVSVISTFSGKITGKSFSGTGTMPSFSQ